MVVSLEFGNEMYNNHTHLTRSGYCLGVSGMMSINNSKVVHSSEAKRTEVIYSGLGDFRGEQAPLPDGWQMNLLSNTRQVISRSTLC